MKLNLSTEEIAKNLKRPEGENGLAIAEFMHKGNRNFYDLLLKNVQWRDGMRVLEIGFGSGNHIASLLQKAKDIEYVGVDYSETMVDFASTHNQDQTFYCCDLLKLDLENEAPFDLIVTINTVYFLEDLVKMAEVLKKHLSETGEIHLGKRPKEDMTQLGSITKHGFITYDNEEVVKAMMGSGLDIVHVVSSKDEPFEREGEFIQLHSDFIIAKHGN